ncbi:ligase-associated DNA damage response exonuclease [Devosia neptuniae]|jgi:putative mRNA 3-end processing factor|uniref:ligase-associated DNA damage response exonuclease n=1 Tax=Devosia TaxID=46913 RepID=UPI0022B06C8B|nr:ligase-associated DNA damage response exonuclease [Devosia neptuniae]MCZ4346536.1 ligase-associated DNA damage response exonuclease [Devosia neptuniae]|tara:strand:- start:3792 stop:4796 length:1005 start_codon:yes stop_codon:yes gene_type:complete
MAIQILDRHLHIKAIDAYIDPSVPRERAIITHGHADHARSGHGSVLATPDTIAIMKTRYGEDCARRFEPLDFGVPLKIDDVTITLFPAGHILGSAQVLVEQAGQRVVVTGDYKRLAERTAQPYELVKCDLLVTEATFGLPVFQHPPPQTEIARLLKSVRDNPERSHLVGSYALGKAQRVIALLRDAGYDAPIYLHGAMLKLCALYEELGVPLGALRPALDVPKAELAGQIVIAPPSAIRDRWSRRFPDPVVCQASGWMSVKQRARQALVELPLVISDHCDWGELQQTVRETEAETVWVTHGREDALVYWCQSQGLNAEPLHLQGFEDEGGEDAA